jgi:parallel beta-helix repeat protein
MVYGNAKDNIIFNNDLIDNNNGIYLQYFFNNSVLENYVYSNSGYGIYLGSRSDGNIVSRNVCNNNRYGIRFKGVSFNEIFLNRFENNEIGLYSCCGSTDNILYKNTLINNAKHASDGFTNSWDNGIVGNYWEDYIVIHPNATQIDDVWDTSYEIPDGNNKDNFPLINPPI